jgi:hypothetical protein
MDPLLVESKSKQQKKKQNLWSLNSSRPFPKSPFGYLWFQEARSDLLSRPALQNQGSEMRINIGKEVNGCKEKDFSRISVRQLREISREGNKA